LLLRSFSTCPSHLRKSLLTIRRWNFPAAKIIDRHLKPSLHVARLFPDFVADLFLLAPKVFRAFPFAACFSLAQRLPELCSVID
jgi:hypothetical protein